LKKKKKKKKKLACQIANQLEDPRTCTYCG